MNDKDIVLPILKWEGRRGWKEEAACRGLSTELFFRKKPTYALIDRCNKCPVRLECLEYAIRNDLTSGIFGGLNMQQREGMTVEDIKVG
jgi:WhiB family redox-sensing transcriptional regulator